MKIKILTFTILFSWIFQIGFPYMKYELKRRECWKEFLSKKGDFSPNEIQQFSFGKTEAINWEKENKEFKKDGNFYDVIKIEEKADKITISCVADEDEDSLLRTYENFLKRHHQRKSNLKLKKLICFFELNSEINLSVYHNKSQAKSFEKFLMNISSEVLSPPPRLII